MGAWKAPRSLALGGLAAVGVLLTACGGDARPALSPTPASSLAPAPSATPSPSPAVAPSATPPPSPATPSPAATEGAVAALYPRGTRTGVSGVDAFIAAMESSDGAALPALLRYTPVPCSGTGRLPTCPAGAAEGTPVDTFYNARCDEGWYIDADAIRRYGAGEFVTFAVARLPAPARAIEGGGRYPAGDYLVVMEDRRGPSGEPRAAIVAGDSVVALFTGCFYVSPRQFLDDHLSVYSGRKGAGTFLLPPK